MASASARSTHRDSTCRGYVRRFAPFGGEARTSGAANALRGGRFRLAGGASELAQVVVGALAGAGGSSGAARRASSGARGRAERVFCPLDPGLGPAEWAITSAEGPTTSKGRR